MVITNDTQDSAAQIKPPVQKMGRPADPTKDAAILAAARAAFLELPYDRVSMEAVAQRAGVSKVTIYAKYKSKEAVFLAAMNEGCAQIYDQALMDAGAGGPIEDILKCLGTSFVKMITSPDVAGLHAVMMREAEHRPELPEQFYRTVVEQSITTLAQTLKVATQRGALACANPDLAAVQFVALVQGTFRYQFELGIIQTLEDTALEDYVSSCVEVFVRGYRTG
jgi:TetR/AcrR family transcriptional regulator, mexJK operon transcriptional repressor